MADQAFPLFDLTPTEEQTLMRESARRFAANELRPIARKSDEAGAAPEGLYAKVAELGVALVPIPEALGGIGGERSPVSNVLVAEDLAHGDMALALGALCGLSFVNGVIDHGTAEQQQRWLPRFAEEGFVPASVAFMEPGVRFDPRVHKTKAKKTKSGYTLSGTKTMVPLGGSAQLMLVVADEDGVGPAAFVVERGQAGVHVEREQFMGLRPLELCRFTLEDAALPADARLGEPGKPFDLQRFVDLSRIGIGALSVGVGQAVLDYVKQYCNDRVAFGEPITNRQAVAFMIADIAIELDAMRLLVYRAAARAERGLPFQREAYLARVQCVEKGMKIGTDGVQLLGGHGFIREHPVELWYRNLRAIGILEGCMTV